MVNSLDHIHVYSATPAATLDFYRNCLGAEDIGALSVSGGRSNHLIILGGQIIAVSDFPPGLESATPPDVGDGAMKNGFGVAHFGLNVDDLDRVVAKVETAGFKVHSEPRDGESLRYVYFTGPDGVVIEVTQYVLPPKLKAAGIALRTFNRGLHAAKRTISRRLIKAAQG